MVDGVETCGESSRFRGIQQDQPAQETSGSLESSLMGSQVFSILQSHQIKDKCKAIVRTDGNTQPRAEPGLRAVPKGHKRICFPAGNAELLLQHHMEMIFLREKLDRAGNPRVVPF